MLTWIIAPLVLLGALIFFHELGHFLACRLARVRVERFSIGFGPKLVSWQGRETEYQIAAFPIGGYVKPLGEEPEEEIPAADWKHSLPGKSPFSRFFIFFSGPLANLLLPIPIFWIIALVGQPALAPEIGTVKPGSPAAAAGLQPGDKILSANHQEIRTFSELAQVIRDNPSREITLLRKRSGKTITTVLVPDSRPGTNLLGEPVTEGQAGILPGEITSRVGIRAGSPAEQSGLQTGDRITQIGETPVKTFRELKTELITRFQAGGNISLDFQRDDDSLSAVLNLRGINPELAREEILPELGILSPELFLAEVLPDSPAARAGFQTGDLILAVDHRPVRCWDQLVELIQSGGKASHLFLLSRGRDQVELSVTPELEPDPGQPPGESSFKIGIKSWIEYTPGEIIKLRQSNPVTALIQSTAQTAEYTLLTVRGIIALIRGQISWKNVGSPIMIVKLAGDSARSGWYPYLFLLVIISINLGIINLLPIPILDGGQIMLLLVEVIIRHPLSLRTREVTQKIGLALVLLIILFAVYNDLARFFG